MRVPRLGWLIGALVPALAWAGPRGDGEHAFDEGRFAEAVRAFEQAWAEEGGDPDLLRRLAAARFRAGDAEGAARTWERLDGAEDAFNAGNAHHSAGRLEEALAAYDRALERDPALGVARVNRDRVAHELEVRRQPPSRAPSDGADDGSAGAEGEGSAGATGAAQGDAGAEGSTSGSAPEGEGDGAGDPADGEPGGEPGEAAEGAAGEPEDPSAGSGGRSETREGNPDVGVVDPAALAPGAAEEGAPAPLGTGPAEGTAPSGAERVLEGVEEGRPRVQVPGTSKERPW